MRVSQRLDYAVRALTALALHPPATPVVAGDLARELGLPKRFLEQQITSLAKSGLVSCQRGAAGGCVLARPAASISVADVVRAVQGDIMDVPHTSRSAVADMWAGAAADLERTLDGVSIQGLAERQRELDAAASPMYYI